MDVARPKGKKLHFVEPTLVEARDIGNGLGYLKVAMFPGMVGVVVANQISDGIARLGNAESLIVDPGKHWRRDLSTSSDELAHVGPSSGRLRPG